MRSDGVEPENVAFIVLTHAHADHACGAKFFKERFGTEIIASKTDALAIEGGSDEELGLDIARGPICPLDYKYIHCKVDRTIDD